MSSWMIPACWQALRTNAISATVFFVGLAVVVPISAFAAPEISGTPEAVSIDAQHSSIKEILSELRQRFDVQFQSTANLDASLTGTYKGPLRQIVARLLAGHNFIIITKPSGLEVTVFGNGPSTSTTIASNASAIGSNQAPTGPAQIQHVMPAAPPSAPISKQEQQPAGSDRSSGPAPLIRAAEGASAVPTPVLTPSTVLAPVPGPATMPMPEPKPSGNTPTATTSTASMFTGNTVLAGSAGTTTSPSIAAPPPNNPTTRAPEKP
jgi:hypothetical protein